MPYTLKIEIGKKIIYLDKELSDPFIVSIVDIGWWDRFKSLFKKRLVIRWIVNADQKTLFKVMNLNRLEIPKEWYQEGPNQSSP